MFMICYVSIVKQKVIEITRIRIKIYCNFNNRTSNTVKALNEAKKMYQSVSTEVRINKCLDWKAVKRERVLHVRGYSREQEHN